MRKIFCSIICLILCSILCGGIADAASLPFQQSRLETSLVGGPNGCCYVLKSNGELWAYSPGLRFWESETSTCIVENVSAVVSCNRGYTFILQKDGTLLKSDGIKFKLEEIEIHDSDVCQIGNSGSWGLNSGLCYLKRNGNLYIYHEAYNSDGKLILSNELLAENVICFADKYTYITNDHVLHYVSNYVGTSEEVGKVSTSTANGFQELYHKQDTSTCFALSDAGDLYAWGDNSSGQVGCGSIYDYTSVQLMGPPAPTDVVEYWRSIGTYVSHPTKIMDGISSLSKLYISDSCVCVQDNNGIFWKWGDAPQSAQVLCSGGYFYVSKIIMPDAHYCSPRRCNSSYLFDDSINGFIFKVDGSIYKETVDLSLQHISVALPFTLSDIAQSVDAIAGTPIISNRFTDVQSNAYYYTAVEWAVAQNITAGTTTSTFSPDDTCTQAQIITFLYRAVGSPTVIGENVYTNYAVTFKQYYYQAMLWAYQAGVVTNTGLNPNSDCTRSDVVTYLWRLAGKPAVESSVFSDVPASADYAQAVAWAIQQGITAGTSATTFSPDATCTRGQIVAFLYRDMA